VSSDICCADVVSLDNVLSPEIDTIRLGLELRVLLSPVYSFGTVCLSYVILVTLNWDEFK